MKTNGSMICRQQRINNAIREPQTPWVYPLPADPLSHPPTLTPLTPLPHFVPTIPYWRRWLLSRVKSRNQWWAGSPRVFGKPSWSLVKWSDLKAVKYSPNCSAKDERLQVCPHWQRWPESSLSSSNPPQRCLIVTLMFALFSLFYFTVSPPCHLSCGKDLQAEQGSLWNGGLS